MRTLVASSASFLVGIGLSVGNFHVPQPIALALVLGGMLGYLYVFLTWEPVSGRLLRARKVFPVPSLVIACIVGAALFGFGWHYLPRLLNAEPDDTSQAPPVVVPLLETRFALVVLPIVLLPHSSTLLVTSRDDFAVTPTDMLNDADQSREWPSGIPQAVSRPRIFPFEVGVQFVLANRSEKSVFSLPVPFVLEFKDGAKVISTKRWVWPIDTIKAGESVETYFVNQSKYTVVVRHPTTAQAIVQGSTTQSAVSLRTRGLSTLDPIPGILPPTSHEWSGDRLVTPFIDSGNEKQ